MEFLKFRPLALTSTIFLLFAAGCESPWYTVEPAADSLITPTNAFTCEMSREKLADTVGKPADMQQFSNQAEYMGDQDGNRYVHVREMSEFWGFLGECVYTVPAKDWPMSNPMPLTSDATKWQDVTWMDCQAPAGVAQNPFLHITPSFPLGAPKTQPSSAPATTDFTTQPSLDTSASGPATPSTDVTVPPTSTAPTAQPQSAPTQTAPAAAETAPSVSPAPTTQPSSQP